MHEIKPLVFGHSGKHIAADGYLYGIPSHMRQHRRLQLFHGAGPLAAAGGVDVVFHSGVEKHLHAYANAQHRPLSCQALADDPRALHRP